MRKFGQKTQNCLFLAEIQWCLDYFECAELESDAHFFVSDWQYPTWENWFKNRNYLFKPKFDNKD